MMKNEFIFVEMSEKEYKALYDQLLDMGFIDDGKGGLCLSEKPRNIMEPILGENVTTIILAMAYYYEQAELKCERRDRTRFGEFKLDGVGEYLTRGWILPVIMELREKGFIKIRDAKKEKI